VLFLVIADNDLVLCLGHATMLAGIVRLAEDVRDTGGKNSSHGGRI